MAERSLRSRVTESSGRSYADALLLGHRWESLRLAWFTSCARWAECEDAMGRLQRIETEYRFETGSCLHD